MRNGNGNGFGRLYERWPQYDAAQENGALASANGWLRVSHALSRDKTKYSTRYIFPPFIVELKSENFNRNTFQLYYNLTYVQHDVYILILLRRAYGIVIPLSNILIFKIFYSVFHSLTRE